MASALERLDAPSRSSGMKVGTTTTAHNAPAGHAAAPAGARPQPGAKKRRPAFRPAFISSRVLIADDNVDAATGLAEWLEAMGYEVYTAYDGLEALEAARRLRPNAVLLDIAMPYLDGDEVCRRLREEGWAREVLIVAVTGFSSSEERRRSKEAGFDHHFVKPVDPREIRDILQSL